MSENNYEIMNIDSIIVAQSPKLSPHLEKMSINIADACGINKNRINVKATTEEKLGFTGENKGMAAHAVCLLQETC